MEQVKTALICYGGGMKVAFTAGALIELAKNFGVTNFDVLIGASSSAPTLTYFYTGQYGAISQMWTKELNTRLFLNKLNLFSGRPIFNLDYLVDEIFRRRYPVDLAKLINQPGDLFIPFYDYQNQKIVYYHNHEKNGFDIWESMKATMTINHHHLPERVSPMSHYVDPELVSPFVYQKAIDLGVTHFLIINADKKQDWSVQQRLGFWLFRIFQTRHFPAEIKGLLKNHLKIIRANQQDFTEFCQNHQVLVVDPLPGIKLSVLQSGHGHLSQVINYGRQALRSKSDNQMLEVFRRRSRELC
ncbi:MAG: hypothetical protein UV78_C0030G0011 [Parcubacteria group bacterium GW2011_GWA2_43_17]|nr:MAG: hypothetical protein UV78_C0030G0011 [Parcubacteria group bacterium GW2011_GWA2_43_17]KKT96908.1 MAG: hypothetical protein UW98_C0031G0007 [Parcubacteria group bacterium GW2011_GWC2_45_15]OGY93276.1 MAG: hypothetical protein A2260_02865 [Candidatus Komeilibacteria bacterium RIFOXYA2_FULL_45_9]HAH04143.1 hypothetical protein [Candidatus Komeilibacteria bacterium]